MPQSVAVANATALASACATPGGGPPVLAAWLQVRRRHTLSLSKRRYVVLTDDHVLLIDSSPALHMVDCIISSSAASNLIDLSPVHGHPLRIYADSSYQFSKWRAMLHAMADASLHRLYAVDMSARSLIGRGEHAVVRKAVPVPPQQLGGGMGVERARELSQNRSDRMNITNEKRGGWRKKKLKDAMWTRIINASVGGRQGRKRQSFGVDSEVGSNSNSNHTYNKTRSSSQAPPSQAAHKHKLTHWKHRQQNANGTHDLALTGGADNEILHTRASTEPRSDQFVYHPVPVSTHLDHLVQFSLPLPLSSSPPLQHQKLQGPRPTSHEAMRAQTYALPPASLPVHAWPSPAAARANGFSHLQQQTQQPSSYAHSQSRRQPPYQHQHEHQNQQPFHPQPHPAQNAPVVNRHSLSLPHYGPTKFAWSLQEHANPTSSTITTGHRANLSTHLTSESFDPSSPPQQHTPSPPRGRPNITNTNDTAHHTQYHDHQPRTLRYDSNSTHITSITNNNEGSPQQVNEPTSHGSSRSFQRRVLSMPGDRDSVEIDPDARAPLSLSLNREAPTSKLDNWMLTQPGVTPSVLTTSALARASISSSGPAPSVSGQARRVRKKPSVTSITTAKTASSTQTMMNGGDEDEGKQHFKWKHGSRLRRPEKAHGGVLDENHHHHHHHYYHHHHHLHSLAHEHPRNFPAVSVNNNHRNDPAAPADVRTSMQKPPLYLPPHEGASTHAHSIDNGRLGSAHMKPLTPAIPKLISYSASSTNIPSHSPKNPNNSFHPHPSHSLSNPNPPTTSTSTALVAVKTLPRKTGAQNARISPAAKARVAGELMYGFSGLRHFALVRVLDVFTAATEVHVVMEHCSGGSLRQYIRRYGIMSEAQARGLLITVLKGIGYLHACGIAHWDVTPRTVLFGGKNASHPKIIGFGHARPIDPDSGQVCATQHPVFHAPLPQGGRRCPAPEMTMGKALQYGAKVDMWQLGCLLFYCLFGRMPFTANGCGMRKHGHPIGPVAVLDDSDDEDEEKMNVYKGDMDRNKSDEEYDDDMQGHLHMMAFCRKRSMQRRLELFREYEIAGGRNISAEAKDLIMKLLCPNPRMRPNALQCLKQFSFVGGVCLR